MDTRDIKEIAILLYDELKAGTTHEFKPGYTKEGKPCIEYHVNGNLYGQLTEEKRRYILTLEVEE